MTVCLPCGYRSVCSRRVRGIITAGWSTPFIKQVGESVWYSNCNGFSCGNLMEILGNADDDT